MIYRKRTSSNVTEFHFFLIQILDEPLACFGISTNAHFAGVKLTCTSLWNKQTGKSYSIQILCIRNQNIDKREDCFGDKKSIRKQM